MDHRLATFVADLDRATGWDQAWRRTIAFYHRFGFEWLVYGYTRLVEDDHVYRNLDSTHPPWFPEFYDSIGAARFDPTLRYAAQSTAPAFTGPDFWEDDGAAGTPAKRLHDVIRDLGARSGVVVPLRYRRSQGVGGLMFGSGERKGTFLKFYAEHGNLLLLAGMYADSRLVSLKTQRAADAVRLTGRERECLLWLSKGLRNDRIAERLGLRNATIEMHLANARRKLEAATREQALAKAMMLGLVEP